MVTNKNNREQRRKASVTLTDSKTNKQTKSGYKSLIGLYINIWFYPISR